MSSASITKASKQFATAVHLCKHSNKNFLKLSKVDFLLIRQFIKRHMNIRNYKDLMIVSNSCDRVVLTLNKKYYNKQLTIVIQNK